MIRTVVLGAVTFLISAGVAVGTATYFAGEPGDLNAALAATLETDSATAPNPLDATSPEDEPGLTLMEEVDDLLSRIEGVELSSVGKETPARAETVAEAVEAAAGDSAVLAVAETVVTDSVPGAGEVATEDDAAAIAAKAEESGTASAASGATAGTASASGTAATGAGGAAAPGLLPEARLGKIFGSMQPRDAARVLEQMDNRDIATILTMLNDRQAAAVLSNLAPDRAAAISATGLGAGERSR